MVIVVTLLVLALLGALAALVGATVTRRAAAERLSDAARVLDANAPPLDHRARPSLDSALDSIEHAATAARDRRARSARAENRLSWALGAIADGVVIFDEQGEIV